MVNREVWGCKTIWLLRLTIDESCIELLGVRVRETPGDNKNYPDSYGDSLPYHFIQIRNQYLSGMKCR